MSYEYIEDIALSMYNGQLICPKVPLPYMLICLLQRLACSLKKRAIR